MMLHFQDLPKDAFMTIASFVIPPFVDPEAAPNIEFITHSSMFASSCSVARSAMRATVAALILQAVTTVETRPYASLRLTALFLLQRDVAYSDSVPETLALRANRSRGLRSAVEESSDRDMEVQPLPAEEPFVNLGIDGLPFGFLPKQRSADWWDGNQYPYVSTSRVYCVHDTPILAEAAKQFCKQDRALVLHFCKHSYDNTPYMAFCGWAQKKRSNAFLEDTYDARGVRIGSAVPTLFFSRWLAGMFGEGDSTWQFYQRVLCDMVDDDDDVAKLMDDALSLSDNGNELCRICLNPKVSTAQRSDVGLHCKPACQQVKAAINALGAVRHEYDTFRF